MRFGIIESILVAIFIFVGGFIGPLIAHIYGLRGLIWAIISIILGAGLKGSGVFVLNGSLCFEKGREMAVSGHIKPEYGLPSLLPYLEMKKNMLKPVFTILLPIVFIIGCTSHHSASTLECGKQMREVFSTIESYQHNTINIEVPNNNIMPFQLSNIGIGDYYCPIILNETDGKIKSPFLLTFAFKRRATNKWEAINLTNHDITPIIPIVFVGDSIYTDDGRYGRGMICFSDYSVKVDFLPTNSWPLLYKNNNTLEIHFSEEDERYPWAKEIESISVQPVDTEKDSDVKHRFRNLNFDYIIQE
jgi:hypothetical protein